MNLLKNISKTTWFNESLIKQSIKFFESEVYLARSKEWRDAAEEGLACMKKAQPDYLMNLIKEDHPDRRYALEMLIDYANEK